MRLSDFITLGPAEKQSILPQKGVLIAKRKEMGSTILLFQLDSYYVEAYCNPQTGRIEIYVAFDNAKLLSPYLESIQIDSLLE